MTELTSVSGGGDNNNKHKHLGVLESVYFSSKHDHRLASYLNPGLVNHIRDVPNKEDLYVMVPMNVYARLLKSDLRLTALQDGGVDDWEWYGDAMEQMHNETEYDNI